MIVADEVCAERGLEFQLMATVITAMAVEIDVEVIRETKWRPEVLEVAVEFPAMAASGGGNG